MGEMEEMEDIEGQGHQKESGQVYLTKHNITSNKLNDIETVSRGSRHRSNHTQKIIPSVVAGHQSLQFGCISSDTGLFPITECDTSRLLLENKYNFSAKAAKLPLQDFLLAFGIFIVPK